MVHRAMLVAVPKRSLLRMPGRRSSFRRTSFGTSPRLKRVRDCTDPWKILAVCSPGKGQRLTNCVVVGCGAGRMWELWL